MPEDAARFRDEFVPNIEGAQYHPKWVRSNPGEASKWAAFRDKAIAYKKGDTLTAPSLATKYGKALVAAGKEHMSVIDLGAVWNPPPPPDPDPDPSTAYFYEDWSTGRFETARWVSLYSYTNPGFFSIPRTTTPDGRVAVVNDPAGSSKKCARVEIRQSDPDYPSSVGTSNPFDKSEIVSDSSRSWGEGSQGYTTGSIRWFEWDMYLPYNANEKFEWAHGGGQPYFALLGFHPPNSTDWSAFHLGWEAWQVNPGDANIFLNFFVQGGTFPENTYNRVINLLRLTNANTSRVLENHNRWISLKWGMKLTPNTDGWIEAWVDGVNVYPRTSGPTMWAGHNAAYYKYGMYKRADASFPESGRSVMYTGLTSIGGDRPF